MKECKILFFEINECKSPLSNYKSPDNGQAWEFPEIEKFLMEYLKSGFAVKNMTESKGSYSFYLERDV